MGLAGAGLWTLRCGRFAVGAPLRGGGEVRFLGGGSHFLPQLPKKSIFCGSVVVLEGIAENVFFVFQCFFSGWIQVSYAFLRLKQCLSIAISLWIKTKCFKVGESGGLWNSSYLSVCKSPHP